MPHSFSHEQLSENKAEEDDLNKLVEDMMMNLEIKSRKWMLTTYKQCFVGKDAVTWIVDNGYATCRAEAIELGNLLLEAKVFHHVVGDHDFKDGNYYYRFAIHEKRDHGKIARTEDGDRISWSQVFGGNDESNLHLQPQLTRVIGDDDMQALAEKLEVFPMDDHNQKLLDSVHPAKWIDPDPTAYNLVVIGAGSGGLVSAAGSAGVGAKVALIEENLLGGDCLNVGCVPSKALIAAAKMAQSIKHRAAEYGVNIVGGPDAVQIDFGKVMERLRRIRASISPHDSAERFAGLGVDLFLGRGKFISANTVEVNGKKIKFKKCIIASGGSPAIPPIDGLKDIAFLTNTTIFNLTKLPKRLGVIGTGPIGCELGQSFAALGSEVTMFNRSARILGKEDVDAAAIVMKSMESDGVNFVIGLKFLRVEYVDEGKEEEPDRYNEMVNREIRIVIEKDGNEESFIVDGLLISTGRKPNVSKMGLKTARVDYDTKRGIKVNDQLQTSNKNIYAVGDCCTLFKFTHVADFMARIAIRNALFFGRAKMSSLLIPWATYTWPEVAHVGLYESDLESRGMKVSTYLKTFEDNDRAICDGHTEGFVKVLCKGGTDQILGATIVGHHAGDMISEISVAMRNGMGLSKLAQVIHPYPTTAEAIRQCGDLFNRTKLTPVVKSLFRRILKSRR